MLKIPFAVEPAFLRSVLSAFGRQLTNGGWVYRNVLRPRQSLRIPILGPRTRRPRRTATPSNLPFQLQKRRETIRILQWDQCQTPVLCPRHSLPTDAGRDPREGHMGLFVPDAAWDEQSDQDGCRDWGLFAYRVWVFQVEVSSEGCYCGEDIFLAG